MAWLERHPTSGHFHLCFRWNGKRKRRSLSTDDTKAAEAIRLRFEENVALLERGRLELPPAADIMTFLLSDGKLATSPKAVVAVEHKTLRVIGDLYLAALGHGSVEANSLENLGMHLNHFCRKFGDGFVLQEFTTGQLQPERDDTRSAGERYVELKRMYCRLARPDRFRRARTNFVQSMP